MAGVKHVMAKYRLQTDNLGKQNQPSYKLQLENTRYAMLRKEVAEKTHELRKLRGEELEGLNLEELMKLEKLLEGKLSRVLRTKCEKSIKEIGALKKKEAQLMKENALLEQQTHVETNVLPQGHSSWAIANYSADPPQGYDSFDTSLKLGPPFPN
ncbi:unnamed protein product [Ilex paraguariensis]|uniref:K-box domain-containing protein n=1 Tax=Ilex paraguariensis TaxID=185542 RepID=A0ABC8U9D8_9AQUA